MLDFDELAELDGLISPRVGQLLYKHAALVRAGHSIVELGSYHGKSTCYLATGSATGNRARVYAVDAWSAEVSAWRSRVLERLPSPSYATFAAQVDKAGVSDLVTSIRSITTLAADLYADAHLYPDLHGESVGLLYIDGDHAKEAAMADFRAWRPHLADGATVIFDDYESENNPGVAAAVAALIESNELASAEKRATRLAVCTAGPVIGDRVPGVRK